MNEGQCCDIEHEPVEAGAARSSSNSRWSCRFCSSRSSPCIDFSRAYSELNAINAALREGARTASTRKDLISDLATATTAVKAKMQQISAVFGYKSLDLNTVTVVPDIPAAPEYVTVTVTAHPVPLPVLGKFLGISPLSL